MPAIILDQLEIHPFFNHFVMFWKYPAYGMDGLI